MSLISYAQNYEDIMLWRALKHIEKGFYIDVGAFCPDQDSITKFFYTHKNWDGINIEPNFSQYKEFLLHRPRDLNLNVAISNREKYSALYIIKDKRLPPTSNVNTGLSTLDENIAKQHVASGYSKEIKKIKVMTLTNIYEQYIPHSQDVHFLKIDVEGFEKEVIQSNKWDQYQPWIVVVEAISPINYQETYKSWEYLLLNAGYSFVYSDQLNRFYISPKHVELHQAFKYPPNFFDGFFIYNQTKDLIKQNKINEEKINSLLQSTSWKITRPLRHFNFLFKLIVDRLKKLFEAKNLIN